ncbi:MAG: hypothetical protein EP305_12590 [Bacteroidetes bacterium]|nr:MAG: hypothetical protein EP305_12590 [Bacteroidota bacterium]
MKSILTISIIILGFTSFGQNTGLYGKRKYIEINGLGNIPLFGWWINNYANQYYFKKSGPNNLIEGKDYFNYGYRIALGLAGKGRTGFGLEFGQEFFNIAGPDYASYYYTDSWGYSYYQNIGVKHEALVVKTTSIIPKIEFTSSGANLPVGINHQIGLGYTTSQIVEKDYILKINQYDASYFASSSDSSNFVNNFIDYNKKYHGYTFLYNFNIKTPISKKVMINYGIRYTLNIRNWRESFGSSNSAWSPDEISTTIGRYRIANFLTFNLGASYSF